MKTIQIADVRVSQKRTVELPDVCPHCQGDLSDGKHYILCYAQWVFFDSKLEKGNIVEAIYDEAYSSCGIDWMELPCQLVSCAHCNNPLVESQIVYEASPDEIREPLLIPRVMQRERLSRVLQQRRWK